eukprot:1194337-Prorocentrum_minimum.AAC.2
MVPHRGYKRCLSHSTKSRPLWGGALLQQGADAVTSQDAPVRWRWYSEFALPELVPVDARGVRPLCMGSSVWVALKDARVLQPVLPTRALGLAPDCWSSQAAL